MEYLVANPGEIAASLRDPRTLGPVLAAIVVDTYGTEALGWEPEVLRAELETDFNVQLPDLTVDRLGAAVTLLTTNAPLVDPLAFNAVCEAFSGDLVDEGVFDMVDPSQVTEGLVDMIALMGPEGLVEQFSEDVRRFMGVVLAQNGVATPPPLLEMAIMPPTARDSLAALALEAPELAKARLVAEQRTIDELEGAAREHANTLQAQLEALGYLPADR